MSKIPDVDEDLILIAGPTASGKTAAAIEAARFRHGVVINADSMQVYRELEIVTARPDANDLRACPHFLFGHVSAREAYSVARWLEEASAIIRENLSQGHRVVVAGGTGLYFSSLISGLSKVPAVPDSVRHKWRTFADEEPDRLHEMLQRYDPIMAEQLLPQDRQRIIRALEVMDATGNSLDSWQKQGAEPTLPDNVSLRKFVLMPPRPVLHERINRRFEMMVENGALEEVRQFLKLGLDEKRPAMKAIGVPQLGAYLEGHLTLEEAINRAQAASRQYAKRQMTWFRNTFDDSWEMVNGS